MKSFKQFFNEEKQRKTITLTKKSYDELYMLEVDSVDSYSSKEKKEFSNAIEKAKKSGNNYILTVSDKAYEYAKKAIKNAIDIADDNNDKRMINTLRKIMNKLEKDSE